MVLKRTSHAVYDTKYHLVWAPKYRKWILRGDIKKRVKSIFEEIARNHEIEIDTLEMDEEHVHIFLSFPPRYSIATVGDKVTAEVIRKYIKYHREHEKNPKQLKFF